MEAAKSRMPVFGEIDRETRITGNYNRQAGIAARLIGKPKLATAARVSLRYNAGKMLLVSDNLRLSVVAADRHRFSCGESPN